MITPHSDDWAIADLRRLRSESVALRQNLHRIDLSTATESGLTVRRSQYGLNKTGTRMFGVIDFEQTSHPDYRWSIGFRNSHDKSMSAGICAGSRVIVCDNMAFSGEFSFTKRRIPRNGFLHFIEQSFIELPEQLENLQKNLERLKTEGLSEDEARCGC